MSMVMLSCAVSVDGVDSESATCTVKVEDPTVVGVPEIAPALLKVSPAGRLPDARVQVYGVTPPTAARVAL